MPDLHTTRQVADRLELAASRIRQLAPVLGVGQRVGRDWVFTDEDVAILDARKKTLGRAKKEEKPQ